MSETIDTIISYEILGDKSLLSVFKIGATSEYPATDALLKSTARVVRGPQLTSKSICIY